MKSAAVLMILFPVYSLLSQDYSQFLDSSLNNLVHPPGYQPCKIGELGEVKKFGSGNGAVIIIPGMGFGSSQYEGLIKYFEPKYTVYAITPAGFGGTPAPEMPGESFKYADMPWTNGIADGILSLIDKENLIKPLIVAHFITGTQAALTLALEHGDRIGKIIIIGGSPYRFYAGLKDGQWNDWDNEMKVTPEKRSEFSETYWAPKWFKLVTKKTWDSFMWAPDDYCKDTIIGRKFFNVSADVPLHVMIRYIIEWGAVDPSEKYREIKNQLLILIPDFKELLTPLNPDDAESCRNAEAKQYLKGFHQDAWKPAEQSGNPLITVKTIPGTRLFMWLDNPEETFRAIDNFIGN